MPKSQHQENVIARPLPVPAAHQPGILPTANSQSDLIAAAVKDGISSALEQLGYSSTPTVSVPHQEAPVTTLDDIRHNWKYPVDPTGERSKKKPWVERIWDKETRNLIVAQVIIPPGLFGRRMRPQGPTVAIAIANAKKMMEEQWAKDNKVAKMDQRARGRFIDKQDKLEAKKIPGEAIWTSIDDGIRIAEARKEHKIPDTIDVAGLGITLAKNYTKTTRTWITEYSATFKPAKRPSPRGNIKTRTNARAILNRLDGYMVEKMGSKVSLLEVIKQKIHLTNFFNEELHTTTAGKIGARKRSWSELVAFLDYTAEEMERPSISAKIHGGIPKGIKADVVAPSPRNDFAMLEQIGGECAGAVTFMPAGTKLPEREDEYRPVTDKQLADILKMLPRRPLMAGEDGIRLSLAGAQDKIAVSVSGGKISIPLGGAPSTHILKPAIAHFEGTVFNEALCMNLARAIGLPTAPVQIGNAEGIDYLLVERYDRKMVQAFPGGPQITERLHQEDFCQALGIVSEHKYQNEGGPSLKQCFDLVREVSTVPVLDLQSLLDAAILNFLIGNHDAHGKNFSLTHHAGTVLGGPEKRLAPVYDVLCTVYYPDLSPKMAMKIGGEYDSSKVRIRHFEKLAEEAGLAKPMVKQRVTEVGESILAKIPAVTTDYPVTMQIARFIQSQCERALSALKE